MDLDTQLAVQSYCFRNFKDNSTVADLVKECGFSAIELCAVHADFNNESAFEDITNLYRDNGIRIASIGVESFSEDEETARKRFEFVKKSGAHVMSIGFSPDTVPAAYRTVEKLAEEYGVKCGIHNHGGTHWLGSSQMLESVLDSTESTIGLCLDTGWALHSGEDPADMARKFSDRLYIVHIKDFIFDRSGKPEDVPAGTGAVDLAGLFDVLKGIPYSGPIIIEYEGNPENPVDALKQCAEAIRNV